MKNKYFLLIVLAVTLTLVGAIITQINWIKNVWEMNQDQYSYRIEVGLRNVSNQVMSYVLQKHRIDHMDLTNLNEEVPDSINYSFVDSLVKKEFFYMTLNTDYFYKVVNDYDSVLYESSKLSIDEWIKASSVSFFLNDLNQVHLNFLTRDLYKQINKEMIILPVMSGLFLILLVYGFLFTLYYYRAQKKLDDLKSDFINNMTHEFKTPIATVSVSSEILMRPEINHQPDKIIRYAQIIKAENNRLENQVNRVLQISSLEKGVYKLEMASINVHEVLEKCVNNFLVNVKERGGDIQMVFDAKQSNIIADQMHFTNVIMNLLENANKFSLEEPQIKITTEIYDGRLKISIKDNGIGIKKEKHKHIFNKFYRLQHGDIHDIKGFGIGLYYVKMITKLMGGEITIESAINQGTKINLFFAI